MRVLRENRESLMAVLEAFVHDPLIGHRLVGQSGADANQVNQQQQQQPTNTVPNVNKNVQVQGQAQNQIYQNLGNE